VANDRLASPVDTSASPGARLAPVGIDAVRLEGGFWAERQAVNRDVTLPALLAQCEESGRLDNFRRAAGKRGGDYRGRYYGDSDVYKWLEAAAWSLAGGEGDSRLSRSVDEVVDLVLGSQEEDGYLNTYFSGEMADQRWTDLRKMHELYCAGHLIQAAIALRRAAGRRRLLDGARRLADHIERTFGPNGIRGACGHPEVEMALVELFRETGHAPDLDMASWFLDEHGRRPPVISGDLYHQDHMPFRQQRELEGHAVRALYLCSGATDLATELDDDDLWAALQRLWRNLHDRRVYVTGGVGSRHELEAIGDDYELPNERAYAETCAGVGHVMWAWRMLQAEPRPEYADALETALYNAALPGVSLSGDRFFYINPLADRGRHRRETWFRTACCPPNLARLIASLPAYLYSRTHDSIWVHLYAPSSASIRLEGTEVEVRQRTEYPWAGSVELELRVERVAEFALQCRIPAWAAGATVAVNGEPATAAEAGTYVELRRPWRSGDTVRIELPMTVRAIEAHPRVAADQGRVAIARGPLIHCVEQADHPDVDVWDVAVDPRSTWDVRDGDGALEGMRVITTEGRRASGGDGSALYRAARPAAREPRSVQVTAVPYFSWGNREAGPMQVWLRRVEATASGGTEEA
jgi:uncharacterized protein